MCKSCGNNSCKGCKKPSGGKDIAQILNEFAELRSEIDAISDSTKYLRCGHPIIMLQASGDIECFDLDSGLGSECFEGWAVCDGKTQYSPIEGGNFVTPNLLDKFIVVAGGDYEVGDTGGANEITLTLNEIPAHTHGVTDPGHTHAITDAGHTHSATQVAHTHNTVIGTHTHTGTTASNGAHAHSIDAVSYYTYTAGTFRFSIANEAGGTNYNGSTASAGAHTHTFTTDAGGGGTFASTSATPAVTVTSAYTGITVNEADTEISIDSEGGGEAHENRPPYFALLFVIKI